MADAQYGEGRQFNLHTAGTDLVEGSALAVAGSTGAISVNGVLETGASAGVALMVGGGTPHDAVDSGNPIKIGGKASATFQTAVAAGDRVDALFDTRGRLGVTIGLAYASADSSPATENRISGVGDAGSGYSLGVYQYVFNGTNWDRQRSSGVTGMAGVGGATAADAAIAAYPVTVGGRASAAAPTDMTADGDVVNIWALRNGAQVVNIAAGGTLLTNTGQAAASGNYSRVTDGTNTASVIATINALKADVSSIAGAVPSATNPLPMRPTNGTAFLANLGEAAASGQYVRLTNGTLTASLLDLTNSDPLTVAIVDGAGTQITSFGGGTQYVEDVALGATPTGTLSVAVGSIALPTAVSADGDAVGLWASLNGALNVIIRDTSGAAVSTGQQYVGDAAATATPTGTVIMGLAAASVPSAVSADNDAVAAWFLRNGIQNVRLVDSAGSALSVGGGTQYTEDAVITANAGVGNLMIGRRDDALSTLTPVEGDAIGLRVGDKGALWVQMSDGSGSQITSFGGGTQYAVDAALGATPTGTLSIGIRDDVLSTLTPVEGDAIGLRVSSEGALWVKLYAAEVSGATAADLPITANPVTIGGRASTATPTDMSADGDAVNLWLSRKGALNVTLRDTAGAAVTTGTQYTGDGAATATPVGTMQIGLGKATVPTAVSADNDAVAAWFLLNGIQNVRMVDSSGNALSVGGGTQYTEDVALTANAGIGNLMIGRRDDALSTLTPVEGDAVGLRVGDKGALWVQISDGAGSQITSFGGGTQHAADTAIGVTPTGTLAIARGSTATPTAMTADGDAVGLWATLNGSLNVVIRDTSGAAVSTGTQYVENVALTADAATGTLVVARRDDALSTLTPVEGDAVGLRVGDKGALWVAISDGSGNQITSFGSPAKPGTGVQTNVASAASDTTILASNSNRLGATVMNDSTQVLYLLLSNATSSATVFTVKMAAGAYYEVPNAYTGVLKGIWASANGYARVTELT